MAKYGKEQRNKQSRAIANSEIGSKQLKGFVDNRIQCVVQNKSSFLFKNVMQLERSGEHASAPNLDIANRLKEEIDARHTLIAQGNYVDAFERFMQPFEIEDYKCDVFSTGHEFFSETDDHIEVLNRCAKKCHYENYFCRLPDLYFSNSLKPSLFNCKTFEEWCNDYPEIAKGLLYLYLEELIHAYQYYSNKFLSQSTDDYKTQEGGALADEDEVDIVASLMDRDVDVESLGFLSRSQAYPKRNTYFSWRNSPENR